MMNIQTKKNLLSFFVCSTALSPIAVANDIDETKKAHGKTIETIEVYGERTDSKLKDTTSSLHVITEQQLTSYQGQTYSDAVSDIANLVVISGALPNVRGVSGNGSADGFNSISGGAKPRFSILVDGVAQPYVAELTGDSGIWDVEQIEVYRGPQSTNHGRNSIAGAMYIKTKDPTFDWQGAGRLGLRNQDRYVDTALMLSGPLIEDTLAFRFNAQKIDAQTFINEEEFATNPADYDLNQVKTTRINGKLLWRVDDDLSFMLAHSSNNEQGDTGRNYFKADDPYAYKPAFYRDIETDSSTTSLRTDYKVSEGVELQVLAAYTDYKWGFDTYEPIDAKEQTTMFDETSTNISAQINFGLNHPSYTSFIGIAYYDREQDIKGTGAFPFKGNDEGDSKAVYGEVDFVLSDEFNLIVGGRVERESQDRDFSFMAANDQLHQSKTFALPKLVFKYKASEETVLALSARKGYNSPGGAMNFFTQEFYFYDEEKVNTFEASVRSVFSEANINLSANLFYNDYEGYQETNQIRNIVNMDEVVTYGAEIEVQAYPNDDIELRAGLGWLESEIKDPGAGYPGVIGNELSNAPNLTASLGAKYWLTNDFNLGASANYVGEYFGDLTNSQERIAGDYTLVKLNASYQWDQWLISAFVNNALGEDAFTLVEPAGQSSRTGYVAVVEPRNVGLSVTYNFNF